MEYYPSLEYFRECQKCLSEGKPAPAKPAYARLGTFKLIEEFSIEFKIHLLKSVAEGTIDVPSVAVEGELPALNLHLNQKIYRKLMKVQKAFEVEEEVENRSLSMDDIRINRIELMKKADKFGQIYLQGNPVKTWDNYTAVISGGYIYFFQNAKDSTAQNYKWIKNSKIEIMDPSQSNFKYSILVKNKYGDCMLGFDREKQMSEWIKVLKFKNSQVINDPNQSLASSGTLDYKDLKELTDKDLDQMLEKGGEKISSSQGKPVNHQQKLLFAKFRLKTISLSLYDESLDKRFLQLLVSETELDLRTYPTSLDCGLKLGGIQLNDSVYAYKDEQYNSFITSAAKGQEALDLIVITITQK